MSYQTRIDDLRLSIQRGAAAVLRQRRIVSDLRDMVAEHAIIESARTRLALIEEIQAEDVAALKRLVTH